MGVFMDGFRGLLVASIAYAMCTTGCSSQIAHFQQNQRQRDFAFQELRSEIGDLKHAVQAYRSEVEILQERLSEQEAFAQRTSHSKSLSESSSAQIAAVEKKLMMVEKNLERIAADLLTLNKHADQTTTSLTHFRDKMLDCQRELATHKQKIEGISQLKATLGQISQAIGNRPTSQPSSYKVQAGDTLEKIAKKHGVPLNTLRRLNNLAQDRILIGQELKLTDDPSS